MCKENDFVFVNSPAFVHTKNAHMEPLQALVRDPEYLLYPGKIVHGVDFEAADTVIKCQVLETDAALKVLRNTPATTDDSEDIKAKLKAVLHIIRFKLNECFIVLVQKRRNNVLNAIRYSYISKYIDVTWENVDKTSALYAACCQNSISTIQWMLTHFKHRLTLKIMQRAFELWCLFSNAGGVFGARWLMLVTSEFKSLIPHLLAEAVNPNPLFYTPDSMRSVVMNIKDPELFFYLHWVGTGNPI